MKNKLNEILETSKFVVDNATLRLIMIKLAY